MDINIDYVPLNRLGCTKQGTFDSAGTPTGWIFEPALVHRTVVGSIDPTAAPIAVDGSGNVTLFGLRSDTLTEARATLILK